MGFIVGVGFAFAMLALIVAITYRPVEEGMMGQALPHRVLIARVLRWGAIVAGVFIFLAVGFSLASCQRSTCWEHPECDRDRN